MGPTKVPSKYDNLKGDLKEMIKYSEEFRQSMLLEAKHCLDRVNRLVSMCDSMDSFLDFHMLERNKRRLKIEKEIKPLDAKLKKFRKKRKKSKKAKVRNIYLARIKSVKIEIKVLEKKAEKYDPV